MLPHLGSKRLGECHSFPHPSQQVLNRHTCAGTPHDPLDLSSFVPANKTAVNDKVAEQQHLVLGHQRAGVGLPTLLTLPLDFAEMLFRSVPSAWK